MDSGYYHFQLWKRDGSCRQLPLKTNVGSVPFRQATAVIPETFKSGPCVGPPLFSTVGGNMNAQDVNQMSPLNCKIRVRVSTRCIQQNPHTRVEIYLFATSYYVKYIIEYYIFCKTTYMQAWLLSIRTSGNCIIISEEDLGFVMITPLKVWILLLLFNQLTIPWSGVISDTWVVSDI